MDTRQIKTLEGCGAGVPSRRSGTSARPSHPTRDRSQSPPVLAVLGSFLSGFDYAQTLFVADSSSNAVVKIAPDGIATGFVSTGLNQPAGAAFGAAGNLYVANFAGNSVVKFAFGGAASAFVTTGLSGPSRLPSPTPSFFNGEAYLGGGACYQRFANGRYFGYYSFLSDLRCLCHFDLGYECVFDANDGDSGVYLYDFASGTFFYTSPTFCFPYLYDFSLNAVLS